MKCTHCGAELAEQDTLCSVCGTPAAGEAASVENTEAIIATETPGSGTPDPHKKKSKKPAMIIAAVAVLAIAAFMIFQLTAKDPKEVVIAAFKNIWTEDQVSPTEELFGTSAFADTLLTADYESSLDMKLDSCSDPAVNAFTGAGLRFIGKNDVTGNKYSFQMGLTYNDMDLANLHLYLGDATVKAALPELVDQVFTLDLGDGLADRIKNSPTVGTYLEQANVDVDAFAAYYQELLAETIQQTEEGKQPFDLQALMTRYREGCKAQETFEEALIVEKNGKGTFTMDGKEVTCTGYNVTIKKDALITFLLTSSEFFLQDETLKQDFLNQLETSVRMSELISGTAYSSTQAPEMMQQTYDEARDSVYKMITYLDNSLTDIQMAVYVSKDGRLASVDGETVIRDNAAEAEAETEAEAVDTGVKAAFQWNLQGGAYLTQNMNGNLSLTNPEDTADEITLAFNRQGTYDKTTLTDDFSIDLNSGSGSQPVNLMYTTSYSAADGNYHVAAEVGTGGYQLLQISGIGVVDELEKGKSLHLTIDELEVGLMNQSTNVILSGEYSIAPLTSAVTAPEGTAMDVLAATLEDWQGVLMEGLFSAVPILQQFGAQ